MVWHVGNFRNVIWYDDLVKNKYSEEVWRMEKSDIQSIISSAICNQDLIELNFKKGEIDLYGIPLLISDRFCLVQVLEDN